MVLANSVLEISMLRTFRHIPSTKVAVHFDAGVKDIPKHMGAMRRRSGTALFSTRQQKTALGSFYIVFIEEYKNTCS